MKIVCKNCGSIDDTYAVPTPQLVVSTTNWPRDWIVEGYCPKCLEDYKVECVNCNITFYKFNKKELQAYGYDFLCNACKTIK